MLLRSLRPLRAVLRRRHNHEATTMASAAATLQHSWRQLLAGFRMGPVRCKLARTHTHTLTFTHIALCCVGRWLRVGRRSRVCACVSLLRACASTSERVCAIVHKHPSSGSTQRSCAAKAIASRTAWLARCAARRAHSLACSLGDRSATHTIVRCVGRPTCGTESIASARSHV